jgi:hypothetical protein
VNIGDLVQVKSRIGLYRGGVIQNAIGIIIKHDHGSCIWCVLFSHGLVSMTEWELRMI